MRIVLLYSATGGGHRAAALAVKAALAEADPSVEVDVRDALVEAGPWPLNRSPAIYEWWMRHARWMWAFLFHLYDGPFRARLMADLGWPLMAGRMRRYMAGLGADVLVSIHPLLTRTVTRALRGLAAPPPFAIVVTDMVSGHWSWFDRDADRIFVPTAETARRIERGGILRERIEVTGQTVHPRCGRAVAQRDALRARFGWSGPVVLLVGGGEGMGRLGDFVRAAAAARLPASLAVVCGRNEALRAELAAESFPVRVEVHGFVDNLHELMAAADVLVTKGGPGSIMEGCVAGLPMLIYDYIPGQEIGNVRLAGSRGFGLYVPDPGALAAALRRWLDDPAARAAAAAAARAFATPDSAAAIARGLLALRPGRGGGGAARPERAGP